MAEIRVIVRKLDESGLDQQRPDVADEVLAQPIRPVFRFDLYQPGSLQRLTRSQKHLIARAFCIYPKSDH